MSDFLVQFQDWISQFPSWMVAGGVVFFVVAAALLFWKAMKIAVTALIVAVVVAGGWFLWERISGRDAPEPEPTIPPTYVTEPAPAVQSPRSAAPAP